MLTNSIITNTINGSGCSRRGTFIAGPDSIIEASRCITNARSVDPELEPLADNGGLAQTHAIKVNSPARNSGDPASCEQLDQRGVIRGNICDVGAFEFVGENQPVEIVGVRIGNSNRDLREGGNSNNAQPLFRVRFSMNVFNPPGDAAVIGDVSDETLYRLIRPGLDGVIESNSSNACLLGLQGDDIVVVIDKAGYSDSGLFTRLDLNNGQSLPASDYSLLVCGSSAPTVITDIFGRGLDGNGDGVSGDDYVLNFSISDSNDLCFPIEHGGSKVSMVCL